VPIYDKYDLDQRLFINEQNNSSLTKGYIADFNADYFLLLVQLTVFNMIKAPGVPELFSTPA
jgi:hypothetical protein